MYFDVAMPLTLFVVTAVAMFLNEKVERKVKAAFEEREFKIKDAVMLVAAISVAVSIMALVPRMAIMIIFLFAYSMLLFIFSYIFSDFQKDKAKIFCMAFSVFSFLAATVSFLYINSLSDLAAYGAAAFFCLCGFSFTALIYEETRTRVGERWYLAALPPALFLILYFFYNQTPLWFPYLLNLYGAIFAILIILYLGSLFTWRTSLAFVGLLTAADIILVLVTRTMVSAAIHVSGLRLPILIIVPTFPQIITEWGGTLHMSLGLGDFFFAGLIAVQTYKKFGKSFAVLSAAAMAVSFFIFEALILNFDLQAFPGTLMIICGWLIVMLFKFLKGGKSTAPEN
jgi:hypothetical protein